MLWKIGIIFHVFVNDHNIFSTIYLDSNNRWRDKSTHKLVQNPYLKRCEYEGCDKLVRSKIQIYCPEHIDWTKTAHGSSILTSDDIIFVGENYQSMSDKGLASNLVLRSTHATHTLRSVLLAVRHHRRKYLLHRYSKKFFYKSIKENYRKEHLYCEICLWNDGSIDVHHILQIKDFDDELNYHNKDNMIALCPNHHRIVEEMRKENFSGYINYIRKYKAINE